MIVSFYTGIKEPHYMQIFRRLLQKNGQTSDWYYFRWVSTLRTFAPKSSTQQISLITYAAVRSECVTKYPNFEKVAIVTQHGLHGFYI